MMEAKTVSEASYIFKRLIPVYVFINHSVLNLQTVYI
jgi:hypothetical protein